MPVVYSQGFGHCPFGNYPLGNCVVAPTPPEGDGGDGSGGFIGGFPSRPDLESLNETIGRYDISVKTKKNIYLIGEIVEAEIILKNIGDTPDEDTVLIYWLSNPINRKFDETREQFLEVPQVGLSKVNKTKIPKNCIYETYTGVICKITLQLPPDALTGEWKFNVMYFTSIQSTIDVLDSFLVKEEFTIIDNIKNNTNIIQIMFVAIIVFLIVWMDARSYYVMKKENE